MRFKELQRVRNREMPDFHGLMTVDWIEMLFVSAWSNRYGWGVQI